MRDAVYAFMAVRYHSCTYRIKRAYSLKMLGTKHCPPKKKKAIILGCGIAWEVFVTAKVMYNLIYNLDLLNRYSAYGPFRERSDVR